MKFTILFTGNYEPNYNRTTIIKTGLSKLGHKIIEFPFKKRNSETRKQLLKIVENVDFIFLPSFTHKDVPFVKKVCNSKIVIFDPLVSRYLTKVYDYKKFYKYSINALLNIYYDKRALTTSDFVITDTKSHLEYYHSFYGIPREKMDVLYIGNNFDKFYPLNEKQVTDFKEKKYIVGFYGGYIPLQGVMNILETAKLLKNEKDIIFHLIGDGFDYKKAKNFAVKENLSNVIFIGRLPQNELHKKILEFDVALRIFGNTPKTELVIPNKIYHYAACSKPIITKDTPAIKELFTDKIDIFLVSGNPFSISQAILEIKNTPPLSEKLALNSYKKIKEEYNEIKIAEKLINIFIDNFHQKINLKDNI